MKSLSTFRHWVPAGISLLMLLATGAPLRGQGTKEDRPFRRDPFWPVGYEREHKVDNLRMEAAELAPDGKPAIANWDVARKLLNVGSVAWNNVATNRECMAIVNGRVVEVGDPVVVDAKGFRYQWVVTAISRKEVSFEKVDVNPVRKKTQLAK